MQAMIRMAENKVDEAFDLYKKSWSVDPTDITGEVVYQHLQQKQQRG